MSKQVTEVRRLAGDKTEKPGHTDAGIEFFAYSKLDNWLIGALWGVLVVALGLAPFYDYGIFYAQGHAWTDLIVSVVYLLGLIGLGGVGLLRRRKHVHIPYSSSGDKSVLSGNTVEENLSKENSSPGEAHKGAMPPRKITWVDWTYGVYVLLYIAGMLYAAKLSYAVTGATDAVALLGIYGFMRWGGWQVWRLRFLLASLAASSVVTVVLAAANGWHQFVFPSAIGGPPQFDLASVFQYHNALGAFAGSVSVGLLVWTSLTRARGVFVVLLKGLLLGAASLDFAGLLLTGSRGALMFWVITVMALFVFLRAPEGDNRDRSRFLLNLYILGIAGGIADVLLHKAIHTQVANLGWGGIVIGLTLPVLGVWGTHWITRRRDWMTSKVSFPLLIFIGVLAGLAGAVVKHHSLLVKLHSYHLHQLSVIQRFIFWADGFSIAARNPITGSGGWAWGAMWKKVESYPYYSTQVHSFVMDTLMNVGIVGLLALLVVVWTMGKSALWPTGLRRFISEESHPNAGVRSEREKPDFTHGSLDAAHAEHADGEREKSVRWEELVALRALAAIGLTLFLHAAMDWDMAFLSLLMVFTVGLAAGVNAWVVGAAALRIEKSEVVVRSGRGWHASANWAIGLSGLAALGAVTMSGMSVQGARVAQRAAGLPPAQRVSALQTAHAWAPWSSTYLVQEGQAVVQAANGSPASLQQGLQLLDEARHLDPYSAQIQGDAALLAYRLGQFPQAYQRAVAAYHDAPYFPTNLSTAINAAAANGLESAAVNWPVARQSFAQALQLYAAYQRREAVVKSLPSYLPPLGPYQLDSFSYDSLAASALAMGNEAQAMGFAQIAVQSQDPHTHQVAKVLLLLLDNRLMTQSGAVETYVNKHPGIKTSFALIQHLPGMR